LQKEDQNSIYRIVQEHVPKSVIVVKNKSKTWEYGYNEKYDMVVISKDGTIGDIYSISGLLVALPSTPEDVYKRDNKKENQYWQPSEYPRELSNIKTIFNWHTMPKNFKDEWVDYIEGEFDRRDHGFFFMNNGVKTYITGSHYMYLQWTKIDVGLPDYREANRIYFIFWEACKADNRSFGMVYLKIRRSGFSFMGSNELSNTGTLAKDARLGILSKTGNDAKTMFTNKVVPIISNYPFFFKPIQDGMDKPKTELAFRVPAAKITKKNMYENADSDIRGLDTTIDWKNTADNSYDGEKLLLLVHDECYAPDTLILTENLIFKKISEINIGDKVIVEGGKLKTVVKKTSGITDRYIVKQPYGEDYIVTKNHRLVFNQYINKEKGHKEVILNPEEYINSSGFRKQHLTRVTSNGIQFKDKDITIPPYLLGLWLGDGRQGAFTILVNKYEEPEILQYLGRMAANMGIEYELKKSTCEKIVEFAFKKINSELRKINVYNNKHIPESYMNSS